MVDDSNLFAGLDLQPDLREPATHTGSHLSPAKQRKRKRFDLQKVRTDAFRKNLHMLNCAMKEENLGMLLFLQLDYPAFLLIDDSTSPAQL
jgi:hypothetical protein